MLDFIYNQKVPFFITDRVMDFEQLGLAHGDIFCMNHQEYAGEQYMVAHYGNYVKLSNESDEAREPFMKLKGLCDSIIIMESTFSLDTNQIPNPQNVVELMKSGLMPIFSGTPDNSTFATIATIPVKGLKPYSYWSRLVFFIDRIWEHHKNKVWSEEKFKLDVWSELEQVLKYAKLDTDDTDYNYLCEALVMRVIRKFPMRLGLEYVSSDSHLAVLCTDPKDDSWTGVITRSPDPNDLGTIRDFTVGNWVPARLEDYTKFF